MFNKAVKQGWLEEFPFLRAENLIRKSLEARRKVTVSAEEEGAVLDFAKGAENKYLYPLVLALRDSGARPSEIFPYAAYGVDLDDLAKKVKLWLETEVKSDEQIFLPWCWFQLFKVEFQVVPLISLKSRQIEYRFGTITQRLRQALLDLWETTDKDPVKLVFPFKTIKKEWQKVRLGVGLPDLRIRDWRRIWRTRADQAGLPEQTAQRILGHKLLETTYHYNEADLQAVVEASRRLDEINLVNGQVN